MCVIWKKLVGNILTVVYTSNNGSVRPFPLKLCTVTIIKHLPIQNESLHIFLQRLFSVLLSVSFLDKLWLIFISGWAVEP